MLALLTLKRVCLCAYQIRWLFCFTHTAKELRKQVWYPLHCLSLVHLASNLSVKEKLLVLHQVGATWKPVSPEIFDYLLVLMCWSVL